MRARPAARLRRRAARATFGDMTETSLPPLLLVGCGKMGGAMLAGWLERGLAEAVVVEPMPPRPPPSPAGVTVVATPAEIPAGFRPAAVVLAIKPQEAAATLPAFAHLAGPDTVFLSIMAGRNVAGMRALLGEAAAVIRAMPNTPAAVRQGFTVAFPGPGVTAAQRALADTLLASVGEVAWVEDEALIDPVTAVSGGGPAYVFLLAEVHGGGGDRAGPAARSRPPHGPRHRRRLRRPAGRQPGGRRAAAEERHQPKGTTERALAVLMAARGLAGADVPGDRRGDRPLARARRLKAPCLRRPDPNLEQHERDDRRHRHAPGRRPLAGGGAGMAGTGVSLRRLAAASGLTRAEIAARCPGGRATCWRCMAA